MKRIAILALVAAVTAALVVGCGQRAADKASTKSKVASEKTSSGSNASAPSAKPKDAEAKPVDARKPAASALPANATAKDVLQKVASVYRSAKTLQMSGTMHSSMSMGRERQSDETSLSVKFSRPNKLKLETGSGQEAMMVLTDGKKAYMYVAKTKQYQTGPAPKTLRETQGQGNDGISTISLLEGGDISKYLKNAKLVGSEKINEVDTYVIDYMLPVKKGSGLTAKERIWIGKNDFLIRQISTTGTISEAALAKLPNSDKQKPKGPLTISQKTVVKSISINNPLPASTFKFSPPAGAKELKPVKEPKLLQPKEMTGKKAPDFTLTSLDGSKVSLSEYKGRPLLIVFWTSLSEASKQGMVEVQELQDHLKSAGAGVVAITLDANREAAQKFVESKGITFPVLVGYEEAARVANDFGEIYLPSIFVVGSDGTVKGKVIGAKPAEEIKADLAKLGVK